MSTAGEWADMQDYLKGKYLVDRCVFRIQGQSTRSNPCASDTSVSISRCHSAEMRAMGVAMAPLLANVLHKKVRDLNFAEVQ